MLVDISQLTQSLVILSAVIWVITECLKGLVRLALRIRKHWRKRNVKRTNNS